MTSTALRNIFSPLFFVVAFFSATATFGALCDFFWGGGNQATAYTAPYYPGKGGVSLANVPSPPMNLGAPDGGIPVQATPTTQSQLVQQANIPTITVPSGPVGTVGQPATSPLATTTLSSLPPGSELMYILPPKEIPPEHRLSKGTPAVAVQVVPPTTPGAIPVAVKTMTVTRPKVDYEWTYAPIDESTETLVKVVDPRTGRVLRTYSETDKHRSLLPWPHRKEVITYEQVSVQVATPLSPEAVRQLVPVQPPPTPPITHQSGRPITPAAGSMTTIVIP